jgi:hypothetical protein
MLSNNQWSFMQTFLPRAPPPNVPMTSLRPHGRHDKREKKKCQKPAHCANYTLVQKVNYLPMRALAFSRAQTLHSTLYRLTRAHSPHVPQSCKCRPV